jgi:hypothetical protein
LLFRNGQISDRDHEAIHNINGHSSQMAKQHYIMNERHNDVESSSKIFKEFININRIHKEVIELEEDYEEQPQENLYLLKRKSSQHESNSNMVNTSIKIARYDTPEQYLTPLRNSSNSRIISPDINVSRTRDFMQEPISSANSPTLVHALWGSAHPCYNNNSTRTKWSKEEIQYLYKWFDYNLGIQPDMKDATSKCLEAIKRDPNALPIFHKRHIVHSGRLRVGFDHYLKLKQSQIVL